MESALVDLLIGNIVSILENEVALIRGVHDEFLELKLELKAMRSFLEDAERKGGLAQVDRDWVANVRDMCYPVEDIIDEFAYHLNRYKRDGTFTKLLYGVIHLPENVWVRHRVAKKIQKINQKLKSIPERNQRYSVSRLTVCSTDENEAAEDQRRARRQSESLVYARDDRLVGIEDDKRMLLELLTNDASERSVIPVVGMGGSGKSTLVASVYNHPVIRRHFSCYAWITVTQNYAIDELLKSMIKELYAVEKKEVPSGLSSDTYKDLIKMVVDYLGTKRYIIVLDDVWSTNLWKELSVALPGERCGSRVILTTRNEKIAAAFYGVGSRHVLHMKALDQREAWELFSRSAFWSSDPGGVCPEELEQIARDLVLKCGGIPLAILVLAGALSAKSMLSEWIHFSASLNQELSNNIDLEDIRQRILMLSFKDLPYHLKRCFLYCSIFPEDYPIGRMRLVRLWIAEGFVEEARAKTREHIAEEYLLELVNRNMLQVIKYHRSGRLRKCKMHDLMRELALSLSEEEGFFVVHDGREASKEMSRSARRLSIQKVLSPEDAKSFNGFHQLRSLLVFAADNHEISGFRLLRVLDLKGVPIKKLPDGVESLFNLRYLSIKRTQVKELPHSIGRLQNLQTLDIRYSEIRVLPPAVVKLVNLRHLLIYRNKKSTKSGDFDRFLGILAPPDICKLKQLQVLDGVEAEPGMVKELKKMTQLKQIWIMKLRREHESDLCAAIGSMDFLHKLTVMAADEEEYIGMNGLHQAPPCLERLCLSGKLEKVPSWFRSLRSLTYLNLRCSRLSEDPLPHIQTLVHLSRLRLRDAYVGERLCFSEGFSKLSILELINLPRLNEVIIKKGVMSSLQRLTLWNCRELKTVPDGIENLKHLQELDLENVSDAFIRCIRGDDSTDRHRIQHIPNINHYYTSPDGLTYESLSKGDHL